MAPAVATYEPREPSGTVLYNVIAAHLETFLASLDDDLNAQGLPDSVQREFYDDLQCGILAHGFLRLGCESCKKEVLFLKGKLPSDADVANVVQKLSRRILRTLRRLGYLEAGMEVPVATGSDPLRDTEPALARPMAASVTQRIAFGERAGQQVWRLGSGCGYDGERPARTGPRGASVHGFSLHATTEIPAHRRDQLARVMRDTARGAQSLARLEQNANGARMYRFNRPWSDGTTGITRSPLELLETLAALVPWPRAHLVRYAGCVAPPSTLRAASIPTPRQQGVDGEASTTGTP